MRMALLYTFTVLLLCGCSGAAAQAPAPPPPPSSAQIQQDDHMTTASSFLPEPSPNATSPALSEPLPQDLGSGVFADPGDLTPQQQDVILQYMDRYYDSLATLYLWESDDLFDDDAAIPLAGSQTVLEYLIGIRKMQQNDLSLTAYAYDLTCQSLEEDEDSVTIRLSEHSIQNFAAYPGVDSEAFNVIHSFTLSKQPDDSWLIANHRRMDSTTWMLLGRYARQSQNQTASLSEALSYFNDRLKELLQNARSAVASRDVGEASPVDTDRPYDWQAAVAYALEWVGKRSSDWPDYSRNGGNCQNFTSQCLLAGGIPMDVQIPGIWKWYGSTPDNLARMRGRSASWSAVKNFLDYVQSNSGYGLAASADVPYYSGRPGDILHLGSEADNWRHTVMITDVVTDESTGASDYLICSNTADLKNFPASAYPYAHQLLIQIHGWNRA